MGDEGKIEEVIKLDNIRCSGDKLFENILSTIPNTCLRSLIQRVERMARRQMRAHSLMGILLWHEYGMINLPPDLLEILKAEKVEVEAMAIADQHVAAKAIALLSVQELAQDAGPIFDDVEFDIEEEILKRLSKGCISSEEYRPSGTEPNTSFTGWEGK